MYENGVKVIAENQIKGALAQQVNVRQKLEAGRRASEPDSLVAKPKNGVYTYSE